jgi:excinuclease UvrABC nuclease subunit
VLASVVTQFYDDKPCRAHLVLLSHAAEEQALLAQALCQPRRPQGRARRRRSAASGRDLVDHVAAERPRGARKASWRRRSAQQTRLLAGLAETFGLGSAAAPGRGLRQLAHHGHERRRRA